MTTFNVKLGGRSYDVPVLKAGPSDRWREQAVKVLVNVPKQVELIANLTGQEAGVGASPAPDATPQPAVANNFMQTVSIVRSTIEDLGASPATMRQLLYAYAPIIAADKEWLEDNCEDGEFNKALMEVVKYAFPLARDLARLALGLANRTSSTPTSKS